MLLAMVEMVTFSWHVSQPTNFHQYLGTFVSNGSVAKVYCDFELLLTESSRRIVISAYIQSVLDVKLLDIIHRGDGSQYREMPLQIMTCLFLQYVCNLPMVLVLMFWMVISFFWPQLFDGTPPCVFDNDLADIAYRDTKLVHILCTSVILCWEGVAIHMLSKKTRPCYIFMVQAECRT